MSKQKPAGKLPHPKAEPNAEAEAVNIPNEEEFGELLERAQSGDTSAMPMLRFAFSDPRLIDLLGGNLPQMAQKALIDKFAGENLVYREAIPKKLELLRAELKGDNPTPLENLLIERVVACWLHLHLFENAFARTHAQAEKPNELGTYFAKGVQRAQKSYLAAIKMLALVRKLAIPVLQVNIAKKQINVVNTVSNT